MNRSIRAVGVQRKSFYFVLYRAPNEDKDHTSRTTRGLTFIDMTNRGQEEFVRASVHYFNTADEIGQLVNEYLKPQNFEV